MFGLAGSIGAALGLSTVWGAAQIPCKYEVAAVISAPGCGGYSITYATGISPNGAYVCGYWTCPGAGTSSAFVFKTATQEFITLPNPPGIVSSAADDVSDAGLVVGEHAGFAPVGHFGFVYDLDTGQYLAQIPPLHPDGTCGLNAINSSGIACGYRTIGGPPTYPKNALKFNLSTGEITELGLVNGHDTSAADINDDGIATGRMAVGSVWHPFLWDEAGLIDLGSLSSLESVPTAIANTSQVVGRSLISNPNPPPTNVNHAFSWSQGEMIDLGNLPGQNSVAALDCNDAGAVVGVSVIVQQNGSWRAVVWHYGPGSIQNLNELLLANPGVLLTRATGISADGIVVSEAVSLSAPALVSAVLVPITGPIGDIDQTCTVDVLDLLAVINEWGQNKSPADLNQDAIVDELDLFMVIENWTL